MERKTFATRVVAAIAAAMCSGCSRIDVDLTSAPRGAHIGEPVTFTVTLRNRSTCPLGNVTALLLPFIPRDRLINRITDPETRQTVSAAVDAFCSGGTFDIPGSGGCQIINGDLFCTVAGDASNLTVGAQTETVLSTDTVGSVTCATDGSSLTCHIPQAMVQMGEQVGADAVANSMSPLICAPGPNGRLGACFTTKLDPNETKTGQLMFTPTQGGFYRNFILAFATKNHGVCHGSNRPCGDNSDCTGMVTCESGICSNDGFGCSSSEDCPAGGTCDPCTVPDDGQLLSNVACTLTSVVVVTPAPTLSRWGIGAAVMLLFGVAYLTVRRTAART